MKWYIKGLIPILTLLIIGFIYISVINLCVIKSYDDKIVSLDEVANQQYDAVIILGAKVYDNERVSLMLADRLNKGIEVFHNVESNVMLMSGDGEKESYDEVTLMHKYAVASGINEDYILDDKYGLSTYDSLYRAKNVYDFNKVIIITQEYHMYRALYIANSLGMDAYGVVTTGGPYNGQIFREIREVLARNKDFIYTLTNTKAKYSE